jgi:cephalosporin hydroxylase
MADRREKPTRYRAVWEFELRFPDDYEKVRAQLQDLTIELAANTMMQSDFLSIEKVK